MARASVACIALVLSACTVDKEFLETELFTCSVSPDCGEGWGCLRGTPYAVNFCAPDCDETCDGVCTGGEEPLCLQPCLIAEDGTPGECQSEDYACVRTSIERNDGLCYPITTCDADEDCGANEICLTSYLRSLNPDSTFPLDNLYCVPRADEGGLGCPAGSQVTPFLARGDTPICYPTCSVTDTRCPPAMACITQLQQIAPFLMGVEGPQCALGSYGLSCQDDTNCFSGRCLDTGTAQGKICTLTCGQASALASGCENLVHPYSIQGFFSRLECEPTAPSSDGSGLCIVTYKINYPNCTDEPGGAYPCASGLECRTLSTAEGSIDLCTRECTSNEDCNAGAPEPMYECFAAGAQNICLFADNSM